MNLNDDYREAEERAQTQMATASAPVEKPAEIDGWIDRIEHNSKRISELAYALRAHRIALAGPEPENPQTKVEKLQPAPNPAKLVRMTEALSVLDTTIQALTNEYTALENLRLVDP